MASVPNLDEMPEGSVIGLGTVTFMKHGRRAHAIEADRPWQDTHGDAWTGPELVKLIEVSTDPAEVLRMGYRLAGAGGEEVEGVLRSVNSLDPPGITEWRPLHNFLKIGTPDARGVLADFMWMHSELISHPETGVVLLKVEAFKHRDTRRYVRLAAGGVPYRMLATMSGDGKATVGTAVRLDEDRVLDEVTSLNV
jgi:hypothetical protein